MEGYGCWLLKATIGRSATVAARPVAESQLMLELDRHHEGMGGAFDVFTAARLGPIRVTVKDALHVL